MPSTAPVRGPRRAVARYRLLRPVQASPASCPASPYSARATGRGKAALPRRKRPTREPAPGPCGLPAACALRPRSHTDTTIDIGRPAYKHACRRWCAVSESSGASAGCGASARACIGRRPAPSAASRAIHDRTARAARRLYYSW